MSDAESNLRPMKIEEPLRINGYDIDVMGIVSNIVYIRWFEDLRFRFLDKFWPFQEMMRNRQSPIITETHAAFHRPLNIFDTPTGIIWAADIGKVRWTVNFEIVNNGIVHCDGSQSGFFFDLDRNRVVKLPEELRQTYAAEKVG